MRKTCLNFHIKAATEMKSRLPLNDQCYDEFKLLDPKHLFTISIDDMMILHLVEKFKENKVFDVIEAERELRKI